MIDALSFNEVTGLISMVFFVLVFIGFWPHFLRRLSVRHWHDPETWMIIFIMAMDARGFLRVSYWDVYRGIWLGVSPSAMTAWTNGTFNIMAILACLAALEALRRSIPGADRKNWNIITAAFYPRRVNLFGRKD